MKMSLLLHESCTAILDASVFARILQNKNLALKNVPYHATILETLQDFFPGRLHHLWEKGKNLVLGMANYQTSNTCMVWFGRNASTKTNSL